MALEATAKALESSWKARQHFPGWVPRPARRPPRLRTLSARYPPFSVCCNIDSILCIKHRVPSSRRLRVQSRRDIFDSKKFLLRSLTSVVNRSPAIMSSRLAKHPWFETCRVIGSVNLHLARLRNWRLPLKIFKDLILEAILCESSSRCHHRQCYRSAQIGHLYSKWHSAVVTASPSSESACARKSDDILMYCNKARGEKPLAREPIGPFSFKTPSDWS